MERRIDLQRCLKKSPGGNRRFYSRIMPILYEIQMPLVPESKGMLRQNKQAHMKTLPALLGSLLAFLLATSCCWLPWLAVLLGGSVVGTSAFAARMDVLSGPLLLFGTGLLGYAGYGFWQNKNRKESLKTVVLQSVITCPECGFAKREIMPTDACQYFYECEQCKTVLKPLRGDCCVFCSYGTVQCPPMQSGDKNCC